MQKKLIVIMLALALSCGAVSCDDADTPADKAQTGSVATEDAGKTDGTTPAGSETESEKAEKDDLTQTEYYPAGNPSKITEYYSDGRVKSIHIYAGQTIDERREFSYNKEGILTGVNVYHGMDEILYRYTVECNEQGLPVKATFNSGIVGKEFHVEYADGNLAKVQEYDKNGVHTVDWEYTDGLSTKATYYDDDDGSIKNTTEWEYDEYESCIKTTYYSIQKLTNVYEFDDHGNCTKETSYKGEDERLTQWKEYEYDEVGNKIKYTFYDDDGSVYSSETYEYDETRFMTKMTMYDKNGKITGWKEYELNEEGKTVCTSYKADGSVERVQTFVN